jgi:beta-phosphoglucomutase
MQEAFLLSKNSLVQKITLADFDAVLFDFDGVIADSESLHVSTKKEALKAFGIAYDDAQIMSFQGSPETSFFNYYAELNHQDAEKMLGMKRQLFNKKIDQIEAISGAIPFIKKLNQYKPCYVVTSSIRVQIDCFIKRHKLDQDFNGYITCDDVTLHKPHPEPYLVCMQQHYLKAKYCLVIEDSPNGITSAKAAGCFSIGLIGAFSAKDLRERGADIIVDSYSELEFLIGL